MFSNLLPVSTSIFNVSFTTFACSHYLKNFVKSYKGRQWDLTEKSIKEDLSRLRMPNNKTQYTGQIDELKHKDDYWLAKYDFRVAKTKESTKSSGNRCVVSIDNSKDLIKFLLKLILTVSYKNIYYSNHKSDNRTEVYNRA